MDRVRDRARETGLRWRRANPERVALRDARKKHGVTDEAEYLRIWHLPCVCCGKAEAGGVDRIDSAGIYEPNNMQPMCRICNYAKRDLSQGEFQEWRHAVAREILRHEGQYALCDVSAKE